LPITHIKALPTTLLQEPPLARSDFTFCHRLRVRYAEIDAQGIVFNAHYLTYFDVALTEYMRSIQYSFATGEKRENEDIHMVKALVEYRAPVYYDQEIDICARAAKIGRSSIQFLLEIHPAGEDRCLTSGEIVWVNTHQKTRKSAPVPEALTTALTALEGDRLILGQ
jgi:acyl-CoA thioester hydrolase